MAANEAAAAPPSAAPAAPPHAGASPPHAGDSLPHANESLPHAGESLLAVLQALLHDLPGLVADRVELFALEFKRAMRALAQIALLALAIVALALTAWVALWIGFAELLARLQLPWLPILLGVHAVAIWLAVARVRSLARILGLPATRRHLTSARTPAPGAPASNAGVAHDAQVGTAAAHE